MQKNNFFLLFFSFLLANINAEKQVDERQTVHTRIPAKAGIMFRSLSKIQ